VADNFGAASIYSWGGGEIKRLNAVRGWILGGLAPAGLLGLKVMEAGNMEPTEILLKLVTVFALLTLLLPPMRNALIEALNEFGNIFRGGPPTSMHPSPADDAALLRKRRSRR
jgi:hypothetical protein